jgi:hypothetical protein
VKAIVEHKNYKEPEFELVDIRSISDDQLDDLFGGNAAAQPSIKVG